MDVAIIGVAGTLLGTIVGAWLSRRMAREDREWREGQTIRERQEIAAEGLRGNVIEAQGQAPTGVVEGGEARDDLQTTASALRRAWTHASLLRDEVIDRTFFALDMTLLIAVQDVRFASGEGEINLWPVEVGFVELRKALDCYLRREVFEPSYPTAEALVQIGHADRGRGLDRINAHLLEHEIRP